MCPVSVWHSLPVPFEISHAELKIWAVPLSRSMQGDEMADHSDHSTEAIMLPRTRCRHTSSQRKLSLCNTLFICFILMGGETPG